jgi:CYTH domain-containing protein
MAIETERKFLTVSSDWKENCVKSIRLRDGLIASVNGRKVRVRERLINDFGFAGIAA